MKRVTAIGVVAVLIALHASVAGAQLPRGTNLFTANVGYLLTTLDVTGTSANGGAFGFAFDKMVQEEWLAGVSFNFGLIEEAKGESSFRHRAMPIMVYMKYLFGNETVYGYAGGGIGVHISSLETSVEGGAPVKTSDSGWALSIPLGINWFPWDSAGFNFGYSAALTDSDIPQDGLINTFLFGIIFPFDS